MRNVSSVIFKFIAILLSALAIITTIFVLLLLSFNRILLNPQTYKQAFAENKVYEQLPLVTAEEFSLVKSLLIDPCEETIIAGSCLDQAVGTSQPGESTSTGRLGIEGRAFLSGISEDQWNALVLHLLTPEDLQESAESAVNETIAYFKGETDTVTMPFTNIKERLTSMTDEELIPLLLTSQPTCTLEQQTLIMSPGFGEVGSPPIFCSATGGTAQVLSLDLQRRLDSVASEIPDYAVLIKPPSPSNPPSLHRFVGKDLQDTLRTLRNNSQYLPILPFVLLLLVTAFGVRSLRGLLRWCGIPIFIGSIFALLLGIIIFFMFDQIWLNYVLTHLPPLLTLGFGEIIYGVAHSLAHDLSQHLMLEAGIVSLLALGLILVSNHIPPPPDPSLPPLAPPGTPGGPVLNPQKKKRRW
jgi:hypothetical protein